MTRKLLAILLTISSMSCAYAAGKESLCAGRSPRDCVVANWGQVEPDGVDNVVARGTSTPVVVKSMAVAAASSKAVPPVDASGSPVGHFASETKAMTSAIRQARFNPDGTIASGGAQIAAAAAEVARKAGTRYVLTLYVRVAEHGAPDDGDLLDRKIRAINELLARPAVQGRG